MSKHIILFVAANPLSTTELALGREARAIQEELERSGHRNQFEFVTRWAARPLDLLRELRRLKPTVVHFSGHTGARQPCHPRSGTGRSQDVARDTSTSNGSRQHGLFFQGRDDRPKFVSTAALEETFGAAGSSVKLVVLNGCYSEVQADALLTQVSCVVGTAGSIRDDAARNFAIGFYGGLGERESVAAAYKQGRAAISLEGLPDGESPKLKFRDGIDADQLVLADANPETTISGNVATGAPKPVASSEALRFSVITIDSRDQNWGTSQQRLKDSPFEERAHLHFRLVKFVENADPLFDITLVNATDMPIILTAVGVKILKVAQRTLFAGIPTAAKIPKNDGHTLDIPDIYGRYFDSRDSRCILYGFGPENTAETILENLPDPIYLEAGAPYRYSLLLRYYAAHMPNWAQICLCASSDIGEYNSKILEIFG